MTVTANTPRQELDFLGSRVRILVSGDDSQGRLGLVDMVVPAGDMPPLHVHNTEDEGFYVMEGEMYTSQPFGAVGHQDFNYDAMLDEAPQYFVLNGAVGALTNDDKPD